ncbi:PREDICTED: G-protein coupled receptor 126 [Nicrophorus vespilloides]|uniref:G-protein coupled receptor 126 n=1 Tax=Nicrophorus vespilloides TaxID=110193 RepID=A0ABM1MHU7_NICVS|nr:PREDICTED: G-protein coupled receptor 126 [Nicrophorus vespilloides]
MEVLSACDENGFYKHGDSCFGIIFGESYDTPCPDGSYKYYNYTQLSNSENFWMPLKNRNGRYIYTSIDKFNGMEWLPMTRMNKDCIIKNLTDFEQVDCASKFNHMCINKSHFKMQTTSKKNVRLELKRDSKKERLILKVYSPEKLMRMLDDERKYAIYCYTNAKKNALKSLVNLKQVYNSSVNSQSKQIEQLLIYQIKPEDYPGQYWCKAYNLSESEINSNTLIAQKKEVGNEFSLKIRIINNICPESCNISTVSKHLENYGLYRVFSRIKKEIRVMDYQNNTVLLHITTKKNNDISDDYMKLMNASNEIPTEFKLDYIRSSEYCLPEMSSNTYWNLTSLGTKVAPRDLCLNPRGFPITRTCLGDFLYGAYWSDNLYQCNDRVSLNYKTEILYKIATANITSNVTETIKHITADSSDLTSVDFYFVARTLYDLSSKKDKDEQDKVVVNLIDTIDNIMAGKVEALKESQVHLNATDTILNAIENILMNDIVDEYLGDGDFLIRKDKFLVHVTKPFMSNISGIAVYSNGENEIFDKGEVVRMKLNQTFDDLTKVNLDLAVYAPLKLLENMIIDEEDKLNLTIITTIFYNDKLFNTVEETNSTTFGKVISVSIPNFGLFLEEPIPLLFRNKIGKEFDSECAYWDYGSNSPNKSGRWSSNGGNYMDSNDQEFSKCAFTHLTHFALLIMSQKLLVHEDQEWPHFEDYFGDIEDHDSALNIITIIGCALSLFGISGIFLTAVCFRKWRQKAGTKILLQLSITISLEIVVVHIADSKYLPNATWGCNAVGICLHYVVLSKFSWMFVSAILQYIRFVKVFAVLPPRIVLKAMIFGWCIPLLPVTLVVSFMPNNYNLGVQNFCYPTGLGLYLGIFAPIVLIVTANLIVFTLVMKNVLENRIEGCGKSRNMLKLQFYLAILLFFMLGIPWVFGILAEWLEHSILQLMFVYLFCLTATLQGFVLFIFYVLLDKDTRTMWKRIFK